MGLKRYGDVFAVLLFAIFLAFMSAGNYSATEKRDENAVTAAKPSQTDGGQLRAGVFGAFEESIFCSGVIDSKLQVIYQTAEEQAGNVYTFLQGPRAFSEGRPWSGEWCLKIVGRNSFGGFGCGLCCMANIYSTLSGYECSPWDMYEYATQVSSYYPTQESGAIGWEDMQAALSAAGFTCGVYRKPGTYEEFQEQMSRMKSAVVLVSSYEDDAFWQDTSGHYVNIWLYQQDTDLVFLAEPGDPERNRSWIPLRHVYDALKTVSQYQYLTVTSYEEEANGWKRDGIDELWNGTGK